MNNYKMATIQELKQKYYKKIDLLDLELIISRVIKKPREFVLANPSYKLNKLKIENLKLKIARRDKGEPLAYLFGEKEFYGLNFKVNKNTLIPRPETEMMVDFSKQKIENRKQGKIIFIDVGTGSGCIIITLAKYLKSKLPVISYQLLATDISKPALRVARQNAKLHKVDKKIKFMHGNLLEPVLKNKLKIENCKLIIAANLPYLTPLQIKSSPSIKYEPKLALSAGKDGLKYYKELLKETNLLVTNYRLPVTMLCEIDPRQSHGIKKIIKKNLPKAKIEIKKDLAGLNRLVIIKIN